MDEGNLGIQKSCYQTPNTFPSQVSFRDVSALYIYQIILLRMPSDRGTNSKTGTTPSALALAKTKSVWETGRLCSEQPTLAAALRRLQHATCQTTLPRKCCHNSQKWKAIQFANTASWERRNIGSPIISSRSYSGPSMKTRTGARPTCRLWPPSWTSPPAKSTSGTGTRLELSKERQQEKQEKTDTNDSTCT